ncbi:MAG: carboxypeptidase regulatory-like domain-containing protein [bacterium]
MKRSILYVIVGLIVVVALVVGFNLRTKKYATLKGEIVDALSGDPIWNVNIVLGGKSTTKYTSKNYCLTRIKPGTYTFKATAPNYYSFSKEIKVKRGENVLDVSLKGEKIPDLQGIIVFTESQEKGIQVEIRFTDSKGEGITKFPRLPLSLEGKLYVRLGSEEDYTRGKELFSGPIELFWDSQAFLAKNKGIIPWEKVGEHLEIEKYGVLDVILHMDQGDFKDTVDDVKLSPEE